ncbi:hypothetical protein P4B29_00185 [Citrobacter freundii]|nr:hypothetical protein [Citrobacter freundii]MDF5763779.1 hypothetical protein [Citrobacter freundii]
MIDVTHIIPLDIHTDNVTDGACQGAHFDPVSGIWYTEPHVLNEGLRDYVYNTDSFNIVAPYYLVITSKMHCWSCHQLTHIHGVMFTRFIRKDQDGKGWQSIRRNTFLFPLILCLKRYKRTSKPAITIWIKVKLPDYVTG